MVKSKTDYVLREARVVSKRHSYNLILPVPEESLQACKNISV